MSDCTAERAFALVWTPEFREQYDPLVSGFEERMASGDALTAIGMYCRAAELTLARYANFADGMGIGVTELQDLCIAGSQSVDPRERPKWM